MQERLDYSKIFSSYFSVIVHQIFNYLNMESENKISPEPKFPLSIYLKGGWTYRCVICKSSLSRNGFLGLFGELLCDNPECENSKPRIWDQSSQQRIILHGMKC